MKKTLIAVAAVAAASAALADTSVTLYGTVDAFVGKDSKTLPEGNALPGPLAGLTPLSPLMNKSALNPYTKNSQTVVDSGGLGPSVIGIAVKEDLGNGLRAFATLEREFQTDTGTFNSVRNPNRAHREKTLVGVGGDWGSISLGKQSTPLKDGSDRLSDAQSDSVFSAFNRAAAVSITTTNSPYTPYVNNSVRYDLPPGTNWRGAIIAGTTGSADEPADGTKDRVYGFGLGYSVEGKWAVGLSHQTENKGQNTVPSAINGLQRGHQKVAITFLSGAVGTPIGKISAGVGGGKVSGVEGRDKGWSLGWTAPINNWTLIAQVASFKASDELGTLYNTGNATPNPSTLVAASALPSLAGTGLSYREGSAKRTSVGVEARYALSKRTTAYAGANHTKNLAGVQDAKGTIYGAGLRHSF